MLQSKGYVQQLRRGGGGITWRVCVRTYVHACVSVCWNGDYRHTTPLHSHCHGMDFTARVILRHSGLGSECPLWWPAVTFLILLNLNRIQRVLKFVDV